MNRKPGGVKTAGIVIAAALLIVGLLVAVFRLAVRGSSRDAITLPQAVQPTAPDTDPAPTEELFIRVDRENVQTILETMERPEAYHQVLTAATLWADGSAVRTVEIWRSGVLARAEITEQGRTRHLLSDGQSLWVWYDGDLSARKLTPDAAVSFDDLTGVPTYETLTALPREQILDAGFVTLEQDGEDLNCLYISARDGDYEDRYWVEAGTQLLCRADSLLGEKQTYQLRQTLRETVTAEDTSLQDVFRLPDGTAVTPDPAE